jgi:hypothetical protein
MGLGMATEDFFKNQPRKVSLAIQTRSDRLPVEKH